MNHLNRLKSASGMDRSGSRLLTKMTGHPICNACIPIVPMIPIPRTPDVYIYTWLVVDEEI